MKNAAILVIIFASTIFALGMLTLMMGRFAHFADVFTSLSS